ncbi:MAG: type II toxin-antitoxin system RelE/ParE family toxin [Sphingobacteriaceae bacterium]|nr:MAG: type II toxin-antitoxin system RelE/ParE family toxin [Sphingobacteriaceae bacterium]
MMRSVVVSKLASNKLQKLFDYLIQNWSLKVKLEFVEKFDHSIEIINNQPESFPQSSIKPGLHKCVITKQTTLYFRFTSSQIIIVNVFDTRQRPSKLNQEIQ